MTTCYIIETLLRSYKANNSEVVAILHAVDIHFIPIVNPDVINLFHDIIWLTISHFYNNNNNRDTSFHGLLIYFGAKIDLTTQEGVEVLT